ncbi:hypothetical protein BP6252_07692 [Coleophoma cylindrospora]|uniref:Uncharacterized protein n=1 Tax=Coleophoma cylindrospora TaxID=1849047 RepID=A0A3D8RAP9_9HELO|nr:hypothetical protein BP6252_07692 [Coleophoma cylindrospora]
MPALPQLLDLCMGQESKDEGINLPVTIPKWQRLFAMHLREEKRLAELAKREASKVDALTNREDDDRPAYEKYIGPTRFSKEGKERERQLAAKLPAVFRCGFSQDPLLEELRMRRILEKTCDDRMMRNLVKNLLLRDGGMQNERVRRAVEQVKAVQVLIRDHEPWDDRFVPPPRVLTSGEFEGTPDLNVEAVLQKAARERDRLWEKEQEEAKIRYREERKPKAGVRGKDKGKRKVNFVMEGKGKKKSCVIL